MVELTVLSAIVTAKLTGPLDLERLHQNLPGTEMSTAHWFKYRMPEDNRQRTSGTTSLIRGEPWGKTTFLNDNDVQEFVLLQPQKPETERSWNFQVADINEETFDLSPKNPNLPEEDPLRSPEEDPLRSPEEILSEMERLDAGTNAILKTIKGLL